MFIFSHRFHLWPYLTIHAWLMFMVNVGKDTIHGSYGYAFLSCQINNFGQILLHNFIVISSLRSAFLLERYNKFSANGWGIPKNSRQGKQTTGQTKNKDSENATPLEKKKTWSIIRWDLAQTQIRESRWRWVYQNESGFTKWATKTKTKNSMTSHHTGWCIIRGRSNGLYLYNWVYIPNDQRFCYILFNDMVTLPISDE